MWAANHHHHHRHHQIKGSQFGEIWSPRGAIRERKNVHVHFFSLVSPPTSIHWESSNVYRKSIDASMEHLSNIYRTSIEHLPKIDFASPFPPRQLEAGETCPSNQWVVRFFGKVIQSSTIDFAGISTKGAKKKSFGNFVKEGWN